MNIIKKTILLLCLIFSISTKVGAQEFNEFVLTYGSTVENFGNVHLLNNKKKYYKFETETNLTFTWYANGDENGKTDLGCYGEHKYLNNGKPLNARNRNDGSQRPLSPRELAKSVKEQLKAEKGSAFFKDKKKKSFNPNFDEGNHRRGDMSQNRGNGKQNHGNGRNSGSFSGDNRNKGNSGRRGKR